MDSSPAVNVVARLDGILVPPTLPFLHADDLGVLHGDGVFETTLVVDGIARDLPEHLERLQQSARAIDLELPDADAWRPAIDAVVAAWAQTPAMVLRLIATRGSASSDEPTCYALGSAPNPDVLAQLAGVRVLALQRGYSADAAAHLPYLLTGAKTISYAVNMAALRYARAQGADDALFVDADGGLLEGCTSTIVVARGHALVTPPRSGILAGITAQRLLAAAREDGWDVREERLTVDDLADADGVYLASSIRLLAPVTAVDGREQRHDAQLTAQLARLLQVPGSDSEM